MIIRVRTRPPRVGVVSSPCAAPSVWLRAPRGWLGVGWVWGGRIPVGYVVIWTEYPWKLALDLGPVSPT